MDIGNVLPPKIPNLEGNDKASGILMTMGEFYKFRAFDRSLAKREDDDYFTHQRIVRQYMVYNDHLLVIHDAGTGKTRTTLGFLNELIGGSLKGVYRKVVISTPSELLHDNWRSNPEIEALQTTYGSKLSIEYVTHNRLSRLDPQAYPATFFIMDEAHQATGYPIDISFERTTVEEDSNKLRNVAESRVKDDVYRGIWNVLHNAPLHKVLVLTATPMQNTREDFYSLLNLVLPVKDQLFSYDEIADERMLSLMSGRVSYVRSAEEGVNLMYGLSETMSRSISYSRMLSGVGKINLGYIYNVVLDKRYRIPGIRPSSTPHRYLMVEMMKANIAENYVVIDLEEATVVIQEKIEHRFMVKITQDLTRSSSETALDIIFEELDIPSGGSIADIDLVFSVSSSLNNKIYPAPNQSVDIVETLLSASQTLYFTSRLDEIKNRPLEEKGLSLSNTQLLVIDDPVNGLTPKHMYHISNLFSTIILIFLLSLAPEARTASIKPAWLEFIGDDIVETGKNILFSEYVESSVGGIQKIGDLLTRIGYTQFKYSDNKGMDIKSYGKAARFIINPSSKEIDVFNDPENWDGSYVQLSLFSSQGAKGVSYKDVRHIHLLPHWSPAENTQALFRGIRAKSHDNIRSKLPPGETFEVRIYKHISTPSLALATYNNQWVGTGVNVMPGIRYFGEAEDQEAYIPVSNFPNSMDEVILYENSFNDYTRVLAKEIGEGTGPSQYVFTDFQFTINGFAMEYVPNPTTHPDMNILGNNLRLPKRSNYPEETQETFYSPMAYKLTLASRKDIEIAKMRLLYKQAAMDCDLNKKRNVLPEYLDNTEWCEYTACDYECLPGKRGLEIVIDTIDPETGEDVRWDRNPWAPISQARISTGDIYVSLPDADRQKLIDFTIREINSNVSGYIHVYRLVVRMKEVFASLFSERQYLSLLSELVYTNTVDRRIQDIYGNHCTLKTQGSILYLCPMYDSERKIYITPEGVVASRFLHGSSKRLFSNQGSWSSISQRPASAESLRKEYRRVASTFTAGKEVEECFAMATDFDRFVRIIEGSFIDYLTTGISNPIIRRFSKFFMETTLDTIDKIIDSKGEFVTPALSPWKIDGDKKLFRVHFHLLYHMHPFFSKVKKPLSENTPIKMMLDDERRMGFVGTTSVEQQILYAIAEENDKRQLFSLSDTSLVEGRRGIIGIVDDKKFIDPSGRDKMEYFKIYVPLTGKASPKHPQGKVCISFKDDELRGIAELFKAEISKNKIETCKNIYQAMLAEGRIR
jgi:hypothetical protein